MNDHETIQIGDCEINIAEGDSEWHDGPGWYYWSSEYPEDGSCGAFETKSEAVAHAWSSYYE